ncbi:MAG: hypothetical protein H7A33_05700 [Deltaproteobacteria bacterium]|nr:hypothetical protein [Deltaproteobacteria bacterium]
MISSINRHQGQPTMMLGMRTTRTLRKKYEHIYPKNTELGIVDLLDAILSIARLRFADGKIHLSSTLNGGSGQKPQFTNAITWWTMDNG